MWHLAQREANVVFPRAASPEKPPVELDEDILPDELLLEEELLLLDELLLEEELLVLPADVELLLDELLLDELLEDELPPPPQAASIALNIPKINILRIIDKAPHLTTATSSRISRLTTET